jgi:PmbA protein
LRAEHLEQIAARAVEYARQRGATGSECTVNEGTEFQATVRMGEVEQVKEAGSRAAGIRLLFGKRSASSYTSDLSEAGLKAMVDRAVELAAITTEDPHAGLPEPGELGALDAELSLFDDGAAGLSAAEKIDLARRAERAALDMDPRIVNSEGGTFGSERGARAFANSLGFCNSYQSTSCSISVVPMAKDGESMERDYWFTAARSFAALEPPEQVGRIAAERTLRRLNPRTVPTQKAAVVFEPRVARSLIGHIFEAVQGEAIYRKATYLADKLGERIAAESLTVVDDSTLPGKFGTSPFDDEGIASRRTVVVDRGVLKSYLMNTYSARRLGLKTTGNASRSVAGSAGIGHGNLYLEKGSPSAAEILAAVKTGLYVTELMGHGFNAVTGDYSRGATGIWIENGELAYPVSRVTIAGNLGEMLSRVAAIGADLEFRSSVAAPTIAIEEMTISGQ